MFNSIFRLSSLTSLGLYLTFNILTISSLENPKLFEHFIVFRVGDLFVEDVYPMPTKISDLILTLTGSFTLLTMVLVLISWLTVVETVLKMTSKRMLRFTNKLLRLVQIFTVVITFGTLISIRKNEASPISVLNPIMFCFFFLLTIIARYKFVRILQKYDNQQRKHYGKAIKLVDRTSFLMLVNASLYIFASPVFYIFIARQQKLYRAGSANIASILISIAILNVLFTFTIAFNYIKSISGTLIHGAISLSFNSTNKTKTISTP